MIKCTVNRFILIEESRIHADIALWIDRNGLNAESKICKLVRDRVNTIKY